MSLQLAPGSKRPWAAITQAHSKAATSVLGGTRRSPRPLVPDSALSSPLPCLDILRFWLCVRYNARPFSITTPFLFTLHSKFKIYY